VDELEQLKSKLTNLEKTIHKQKIVVETEDKILKGLREQLKEVASKIKDLQPVELRVSDHAILRYLERVMGVDKELIVEAITDDIQDQVDSFGGSGTYPLREIGRAVVKNHSVVTIIRNSDDTSV